MATMANGRVSPADALAVVRPTGVYLLDFFCSVIHFFTEALLLLSLLHFNHANSIQMGDGLRIMNSNKHLYLLYKCHNCPKHAYGLLETQVQRNVLPSQRNTYRVTWNRTVNHRGAVDTNHPNDLDIEHQNKSFKDQAHSYRGVYCESNFSCE